MKKLVFVLLLLILAGCQAAGGIPLVGALSQGAFTSQLVFNRQAKAYAKEVRDFKLLGTRNLPGGRVAAIYTFGGPEEDHVTGFFAAEQTGRLHWEIVENYQAGSLQGDKNLPLDFALYQGEFSAAFGPVYERDIEVVDVLFVDGTWYRDQVRGEYFAVFSQGKQDVCGIRALDGEGQVVYEGKFTQRSHGEYSDECF